LSFIYTTAVGIQILDVGHKC